MTWTPDDTKALRDGQLGAIDRLYRELAPVVLGWVIRLGGPSLDAEDVAQEVFVVALRRVSDFRGDAAVSTWMFAITRNVVANARRRAMFRRFLGLEQAPEPVAPNTDVGDALDRLRQRRVVQTALEALPMAQREAVVLIDLEGRPAAEAAEMLGVPVGTVYSRVHTGRRALGDALRAQGVAERFGFAAEVAR